ncbi:hypothetical protein Pint_21912 [Pistacia integerrima]|uniref:Uncharacterized protein n=1 Tax=Pistacia integerrima TaxID=434235 RepID=A0ACC0XC41_9ROSI|nr:hypothetical protein Pint_21912 [Pistacia integerrima]
MTNNFETVLGKEGFGTTYHGYLDDNQVAVKMLSLSSAQGYKEFQAEVELLMRVHHKNLIALFGYCDEGTNMGLTYELMANGDLETNLKDIRNIVDPRLPRDFDINSAWKAVELVMACASLTASKRPTMNRVVTELNECWQLRELPDMPAMKLNQHFL